MTWIEPPRSPGRQGTPLIEKGGSIPPDQQKPPASTGLLVLFIVVAASWRGRGVAAGYAKASGGFARRGQLSGGVFFSMRTR